VTSSDSWFRPVDIKAGPDGAIYIADWYDRQVTHTRNQEGNIDTSNGRIYRLKKKGAKPVPLRNLATLPSGVLTALLDGPNEWVRQTALRVLADRHDRKLVPSLEKCFLPAKTEDELTALKMGVQLTAPLEALWASYLSGGWSEKAALACLEHRDPFIRTW